MDLNELKELLQILEEKEITEFELEEEGMKLRVRKAAANHASPPPLIAPLVPAILPGPALVPPAPAAPSPPSPPPPLSEEEPAARATEDDGLIVVTSPIVGTFYRTPDPNAPPFVEVGDHVRKGQVLCIIEAMKLMNEIEAEAAGTVARVHHESGQPVQYGDPLFSIRPD